jgi:beta-ribofuranosylaminobenzene 5'-phosphate synthase
MIKSKLISIAFGRMISSASQCRTTKTDMGFRVIARPRIHTGLIDLAGISARSFCGVGFSISAPQTVWLVENSRQIQLSGISHLDESARQDIDKIVNVLKVRVRGGFSATLETGPRQHIGLGTKTSLLLSLIAAIAKLKKLNLSNSEIQRLSGRGGASGVGINLFFCGGIVWDGGHPVDEGLSFSPSSVSPATETPPLLARWTFPDQWLVGLILPDRATFSGEKELAFFKATTPIAADQTLKTMSAVYHGLIPAFVLADIGLLKNSLQEIHSVGFKQKELHAQTSKTVGALETIQSLPRVAAGMSSLGPLLYCIFQKDDFKSRTEIETISREIGADFLGEFSGCNGGFEVQSA